MIQIWAHLVAAAATLMVMRWRWSTETKKWDKDWWAFMAFQGANVVVQIWAGLTS